MKRSFDCRLFFSVAGATIGPYLLVASYIFVLPRDATNGIGMGIVEIIGYFGGLCCNALIPIPQFVQMIIALIYIPLTPFSLINFSFLLIGLIHGDWV